MMSNNPTFLISLSYASTAFNVIVIHVAIPSTLFKLSNSNTKSEAPKPNTHDFKQLAFSKEQITDINIAQLPLRSPRVATALL
jgi:hypothetical protein